MRAVNPAYVVIQLIDGAMSIRLPAGARADGKTVNARGADIERALVRHIAAVHRYAQIASIDKVGIEATNSEARHGTAELIHHVRAKQIRIARGPGLVRVIQSSLGGTHN